MRASVTLESLRRGDERDRTQKRYDARLIEAYMGTMRSRRMMSTNKIRIRIRQNGSYKNAAEKGNTYSAALVSVQVTAKISMVPELERGSDDPSGRTLVYHWRCLLMSQKEVTLATIVKKLVTIHPTSCATSHHTQSVVENTWRWRGGGRLIKTSRRTDLEIRRCRFGREVDPPWMPWA
jgi:hypothetical protein